MLCFTPDFYDDFRCIADACPDSCCKEWEVDVDSKSATFYRTLEGPLGERLRQVLKDTEDGTIMTIENGRCPMWRQDGLCRIHAELGHDALSQICREYPRIRHDYGDFVELGLELSCPEAARLILSSPYRMKETVIDGESEPDYDVHLMQILLRSRGEALSFLEEASLPLPQKLAVLLLYAHDVQEEIDGGTSAILTPDRNLQDAFRYAEAGNFSLITEFFLNLEILTPQWKARLASAHVPAPWNDHHLALARYFIHRYWLQAVADYDLICRVKFLIVACLLVRALGDDTVATAQLFSKEIENDPDNLETILDGAYTSEAFTDVHLLSLLINS